MIKLNYHLMNPLDVNEAKLKTHSNFLDIKFSIFGSINSFWIKSIT